MDPSDFTFPNASLSRCYFGPQHLPGGPVFSLSIQSFNILASASAIFVNMFIAWALWSRRRFHSSRSGWFVLSLVLGAMLGGSFELASLAMDTICPLAELLTRSETLCVLKILSTLLQWMININMHALIAVDRYLLIVHSLRYGDLMTKRRALTMIGGAWLLSVLAATSVLVDNKWRPGRRCVAHDLIRTWHVMAVQLPVNVLVLAIVVSTHLRIRTEARRSEERHRGFGGIPRPRVTLASKSARVLSLVVGCYVLSFIPSQVVLVLRACNLLTGPELYVSMMLAWPLCVASLLVNPLLYTWKNALLRGDLVSSWVLAKRWMEHSLRRNKAFPPSQHKQTF